jgi:diguanylate cyclase (GGDEF)-like protein
MNFHIPTAMQLTATMTLLVGIALAFAMTGYPRNLQHAIRQWVRGLLLQPISFILFSLRGSVPDWLSVVVGNAVLLVSFAHFVLALRTYRGRNDGQRALIVLVVITLAGQILLTHVWPDLHGRILLISLVLSLMAAMGVIALFRHQGATTRPEQLVAVMLLGGIVVLMARALNVQHSNLAELTSSSPLQGIVFTYASLLPVIATSGFLLMCGERLNKDLARLAMFDPLTGVHNRRTMSELANRAIAASRRHGRPLSLLIIDIDHFKHINDQFGHEAGDLALCRVVELIGAELRASDILARLGGEEFVVILADADEKSALVLAERIRERLCQAEFSISGWPVALQASIGVGALGPEISDLESLLRHTDRAMYAAKRAGRNRVVAVSRLAQLASGVGPDTPA